MKNNKKEKVECTCGCGIDECDCEIKNENCECDSHECHCHEENDNKCECGCCDEHEIETIILRDEKNNEVEFMVVAEFPLETKNYIVLVPMEKLEDIDEDECLIFRLEASIDDEEGYDIVPIESEDEMKKAYDEYERLYYANTSQE